MPSYKQKWHTYKHAILKNMQTIEVYYWPIITNAPQ
jgi:hypothetical protein